LRGIEDIAVSAYTTTSRNRLTMAGLIPLMLGSAPGNRTSVAFPPSTTTHRSTSPTHSPTHRRTASASAINFSIPARSRSLRRLSQASPAVLPVLPHTAADWKRAIAEVKRQHSSRRHRACFMRCTEILDNVKDQVSEKKNLHPARRADV